MEKKRVTVFNSVDEKLHVADSVLTTLSNAVTAGEGVTNNIVALQNGVSTSGRRAFVILSGDPMAWKSTEIRPISRLKMSLVNG